MLVKEYTVGHISGDYICFTWVADWADDHETKTKKEE